MNLSALASLLRFSQTANLQALGMAMPGGLGNGSPLAVPGSLSGLSSDTANFPASLGNASSASGPAGSGSGTYGSSSASGSSGGGGSSSGSGDVTKDAADAANKLGLGDKLKTGGTEDDVKKMIKNEGKQTKTLNKPDAGTVKSEMGKKGVTGGVLMLADEAHAVEINPGGDAGSAGSSAGSSSGKGSQLADKQQGPNGTDSGCWACSAQRAGNSNNKHDGKIHDSGDGQEKDPNQFLQQHQIEQLVVSFTKDNSSAA